MVLVIEAFRDKETGFIYKVGEEYNGARVEFLTGKGVLKATDTQSTNFSNLKIDELKRELDELGVNYDFKAKKAELLELLEYHTD